MQKMQNHPRKLREKLKYVNSEKEKRKKKGCPQDISGKQINKDNRKKSTRSESVLTLELAVALRLESCWYILLKGEETRRKIRIRATFHIGEKKLTKMRGFG